MSSGPMILWEDEAPLIRWLREMSKKESGGDGVGLREGDGPQPRNRLDPLVEVPGSGGDAAGDQSGPGEEESS